MQYHPLKKKVYIMIFFSAGLFDIIFVVVQFLLGFGFTSLRSVKKNEEEGRGRAM